MRFIINPLIITVEVLLLFIMAAAVAKANTFEKSEFAIKVNSLEQSAQVTVSLNSFPQ